jgi:hypothetical protein
MDHAHHVGVEDAPESRQVVGFLGQRAHRHAGVGDDDVRHPGARAEVRPGVLQRDGIGDIERIETARAAEFGSKGLQQVESPRGKAEQRAPRGVVPRQRRADTRRSAGDEYAQRRFQRVISSWQVGS